MGDLLGRPRVATLIFFFLLVFLFFVFFGVRFSKIIVKERIKRFWIPAYVDFGSVERSRMHPSARTLWDKTVRAINDGGRYHDIKRSALVLALEEESHATRDLQVQNMVSQSCTSQRKRPI